MKASKHNKSDRGRAGRPAPAAPAATAAPKAPWWPYPAGLALALFVALNLYSPALTGPFVFDDRYLPFLDPRTSARSFLQWISGVRPLLMLTFWFNYQIGGIEPYGYKLLNVLLHWANAALIWLALRKILEWAGVAGAMRHILSVFGGALFLLHPVQTESVAYAASRSETLSVFLFYVGFVLFAYRRSAGIGWPRAVAVLLLFGAAVLTKEHTAVLPALLLLTDYFWNPPFSFQGIRRNWRLYVPALVVGAAGGLFIARVLRGALTAGFGMRDMPWYSYFFTQCRAIWVYIRLFFLPYGQNVDYDYPLSRGLFDHGAVFGLAGLVAVSVLAWWYRRRFPLAAYGWFVFLILLAPTSSFVPIQDLVVERRLYLPFLGLLLICAEGLRRLRVSRAALTGALGTVLVVSGVLTLQRNTLWGNEVALWTDSAEKSPRKVRPRFHVAYGYFTAGDCARASSEFQRAASLAPPDLALLVDWGSALDCAGRAEEALDKFRAAAKLEKTAQVFSLIGMVHAKRNQRAEAFAALAEAERLDPNFVMTYVYRGNLFLMSQEFDRAAEQFRRALAIDPGMQAARNGLLMAQRRTPVS